jgi:hypothetical protein
VEGVDADTAFEYVMSVMRKRLESPVGGKCLN